MAEVEERSASEEEVSEEEAPAKEESDSDEEYGSAAKKAKKKPAKASPKKRKGTGDEDDEEWGKSKKNAKASVSLPDKQRDTEKEKPAGRGRGKKNSAFTRSYQLSEELADVVGGDVMPRHEVVKKLWAVIKERKLQDPKNKQFAICDDQLMKVIGVKKFRTFGMMKYLKNHFIKTV